MYWKFYDNIDIPNEIVKDIVSKGSKPETITRAKRRHRRKA
jgi:hypothetical protein